MINILILKDNQKNIKFIEATGHSGYAEEGSDIVCSAVSTLMQSLAVGLTEVINMSPKIIIDETIPHMCINLLDGESSSLTKAGMENVQTLMQTTVLSLRQVANEFNRHIKIKEKQV